MNARPAQIRKAIARMTEPWRPSPVLAPQIDLDAAKTRLDALTHMASIQQFLYREARLLDERRWHDWLGLWAEDGVYRMPTRSAPQPLSGDPSRPVEREMAPDGGVWWVDDERSGIELRVRKLATGKAWSEEPPARTRRLITNVECGESRGDGVVSVRSNLLLYRTRRESDQELFAAARVDRLRPADDGSFRLVERRVTIDATVVVAANLVLFF